MSTPILPAPSTRISRMKFLLASCQTEKSAGQGGIEEAGIVPKNGEKKSTYAA